MDFSDGPRITLSSAQPQMTFDKKYTIAEEGKIKLCIFADKQKCIAFRHPQQRSCLSFTIMHI